MAKKAPAKKLPAKRKPRAKKPETLVFPITDPTDYGTPVEFPAWLVGGLKAVSLLVLGSLGGIWAAGGIDVSPGPGPTVNDCLTVAHAADRVSQVRILREYAGKSFSDEPTAQSWLNAQRIEARKNDWIPYTDELGSAADSGIDAVKALADKLEDAR